MQVSSIFVYFIDYIVPFVWLLFVFQNYKSSYTVNHRYSEIKICKLYDLYYNFLILLPVHVV